MGWIVQFFRDSGGKLWGKRLMKECEYYWFRCELFETEGRVAGETARRFRILAL